MLTSFSDDEPIFAAVRAGAAEYVLEQVRGSELVKDVEKCKLAWAPPWQPTGPLLA
jgi:DNA-binding NarL/FixJ family response regulator